MLQADTGKRVFSCHRAGYAALLDRVQKHCEAHLDESVTSLLVNFGIKMKLQQENTIDFMSRCADATISSTTSLRWFLE